MKKITLTAQEFNVFKEIASFMYQFWVSKGIIHIQAQESQLAELGY